MTVVTRKKKRAERNSGNKRSGDSGSNKEQIVTINTHFVYHIMISTKVSDSETLSLKILLIRYHLSKSDHERKERS